MRSTSLRSRRWARRVSILVCVCVALVPAAQPAGGAVAVAVSGPVQPTTGLGANGPCGQTATSIRNPRDITQVITVISPTGSAPTPLVGGSCGDSRRPVVAVVHGLSAGIDAQLFGFSVLYADLIAHQVSIGNTVIFATYNTDTNDFVGSYQREDQAIAAARALAPRGDFSRFGIIGHSMGGGAVPYLAQRAAARGWGSIGLWLLPLAPWYVHGVGTGPITVPPNTRAVVVNYDNDTYVDNRIGIDLYRSLALPPARKQHVTDRSQTRGSVTLNAQHTTANSLIAPNDAMKFFGIYRVSDALQSCSLLGVNCDTDLSVMGSWSDGQPVTPALSSDDPVDSGPITSSLALFGAEGECDAPMNPRTGTCDPATT